MSYEDAPATRMLATNCACCRRPLVDAKSCEAGMGPSCRSKHGFNIEVSQEARVEANKIVYGIALENSKPNPEPKVVTDGAIALRALGFEKLAGIIIKRAVPIRIEAEGDTLVVFTPYNESAVDEFRRIPGRRFDKERKVNVVPGSCRRALFEALCRVFPGMLAVGPKGAFVLGVG